MINFGLHCNHRLVTNTRAQRKNISETILSNNALYRIYNREYCVYNYYL